MKEALETLITILGKIEEYNGEYYFRQKLKHLKEPSTPKNSSTTKKETMKTKLTNNLTNQTSGFVQKLSRPAFTDHSLWVFRLWLC